MLNGNLISNDQSIESEFRLEFLKMVIGVFHLKCKY